MLISGILTQVRDLLNETVTGFWTDAELLLYGWQGEKELVILLREEFLNNLLKKGEITKETATLPVGFTAGKLFKVPTDYMRFAQMTDHTNNVPATLVQLSDIKIYRDNTYYIPTTDNPICFFFTTGTPPGTSGIAFVPFPIADTVADLRYFCVPQAWATGNEPQVADVAHSPLIDYICWKALEKDHEALMAKYEQNYRNALAPLMAIPGGKTGGKK